MKIIIKIACMFVMIYMLATSCEDIMGNFLEKPPGLDVTEDTVFSTQINTEKFLMGIYFEGMYSGLTLYGLRNGRRDAPYECFSDEAEACGYWMVSNVGYNIGNLSAAGYTSDELMWQQRWRAIRSINIFLDRIDGVPDADQDYKNYAKGQALFIRGLCYFEMFKRYGGVPIVDKRFDLSDPENLKEPRKTIAALVDFIVQDADDAFDLLPDSWPEHETGKATKMAALMLKSRTLLYAASPLTNTASPPLSLPGELNKLICYGDYDENRWKLAYEAAKDVLDWAPGAGVHLLTGSDRAYQDVWEIYDNAEVIMSPKLSRPMGPATTEWGCLNNFYYQLSGVCITQNFVEKYEKKNGTPQIWNPNGGNNLNEMFAELDPRFGQSVGYNNSYWNNDFPVLKMWEGAVAAGQPPLHDLKTGYWLRKWIPPALRTGTSLPQVWNLYRLAEAYLNYAEALNEYYPNPPAEAYDAVRIVRDRVGMPPFPQGMTQTQFREKIRNERSIELAFEEHRLWDIKRWVIAEQDGVMQGDMRGIKIYRLADPNPNDECRWEPFVFEKRTWKNSMYRLPFSQNEINKGYLIQNPGW